MASRIELPPIVLDPKLTFASLRSTHPLLLLPVRLETRFQGDQLEIRVYPDQVHLNEHRAELTTNEVTLARKFWRRYETAQTDDQRATTVSWLTERIAPRRAAWVVRTMHPRVRDDGTLIFPRPVINDEARPAVASCLPDRWCAVGYVGGVRRFTKFGKLIIPDLALMPKLEDATPWSNDPDALPVDEGVAWMIDYQKAVDAGMAITVDLSTPELRDIRTKGLDTLIVVGVSSAVPADGANAWRRLLEAHHYTDGLEFLPQGTPTNNSDDAIAGWTGAVDDPHDFLARELETESVALHDDSDAVRLSSAFGLRGTALLGRVRNGTATEETSARAMNRALWLVTWGRCFDELLAPRGGTSVIPRAAIDRVRDWFITNVRGGAALPVIACHSQPYGILPVRRTVVREAMSDPFQMLEYVLLGLREDWRTSLTAVPRLDPVLGASGGADTNEAESDIVTILGTLPHPGRFQLRGLYDQRELRVGFWEFMQAVLNQGGPPFYGVGGWYEWESGTIHDADSQIQLLEEFKAAAANILAQYPDAGDSDGMIDAMIRIVQQHKARQEPVNEFASVYVSGVLDEDVDDPVIFYAGYGTADETQIWTRPLVQAEDATAGETAYDYLADLRARIPFGIEVEPGPVIRPGVARTEPLLRRTVTARRPATARSVVSDLLLPTQPAPLTTSFHENEPLLYQLIDSVVSIAADLPFLERGAYRAALQTLQGTPVGELELRLRETLGLATHRIDAWFTGLARERLDQMRAATGGAQGVQLGGFGWVELLRPDAAGTRETQGFIHAPSMAHAATAAVLRAGWSVHGTSAADSTLAVDLRSDRMRLAAWLLDGVRQGQSLGDLLGRRFERQLHDRNIDEFIDDCRRGVLASNGITRDPRGPVDGLELAELYQTAGVSVDGGTVTIHPDHIPATEPLRRLKRALGDILSAMDAISDAAIADSVHHMLQGNRARASATLDAVSTAAVPPPELRSADTPIAGVGITHRVLVTLGATAISSSAWGSGPRSILDPQLESCVAGLLGDPNLVRCSVGLRDDPIQPPIVVTLAQLAVSALDAVYEAPAGDPGGDTTWTRRIEAHILATHPEFAGRLAIDFEDDARPAETVSFREFSTLARAVRSLLGRSRPLDARDLSLPGTTLPSGWDVEDVEERVARLRNDFSTALGNLEQYLPKPERGNPQPVGSAKLVLVRTAMIGLAGYALRGAIPRAGWHESTEQRAELYGEAWQLAERARARRDVIAKLEESWAREDKQSNASADRRVKRMQELVAVLLGKAFPLLPRFMVAAPADVSAAFTRSDELLGNDSALATGWLQRIAKVRPGAALLNEVFDLRDAVADESTIDIHVAQLPSRTGESWVARHAPIDSDQGRLALFAFDDGGIDAIARGDALSGMCVDSWTERIPATDLVTGVAVHYDAPSSRPPQSLLLVVPPESEVWSFDLVVDSLLETLEFAKLRAVDPESLQSHGQHVPAIFPPRKLDPGAQPAEASA